MSEQELLSLCKKPEKRTKHFWTSEIYGFGKVLRKMGFYPDFLPLSIYFSHGVTMYEKPAPHELDNAAPVMIYFSPRLVAEYRKISKKPCYCIVSPNVYYRRLQGIQQAPDAKGTLAFFSHSTPDIDNDMDVSSYMKQLRSLPDKYQPVSVCLHYHDVEKGFYKIFQEQGFEVLTVGNSMHVDFIPKFYGIIRNYSFVTSNDIGSYTFYAAEMGIPFFLYGSEPEYFNRLDSNIEQGQYDSYKRTAYYKKIKSLFGDQTDAVSPEQLREVENELGVYNTISRLKLMYLLYFSYVSYRLGKLKGKILKRINTHDKEN